MSDDEQQDTFRKFAERWNEARREGGGTDFGAVSFTALKICKKTIEEAPNIDSRPSSDERTAQDAALEIIKLIEMVKRFISEGRIDDAARLAWSTAGVFAEAEYKFGWKLDADRGLGTRLSASDGGAANDKLNHEPVRRDRLAEMKRLIDEGHNISQAAGIAFKNGHGASKEANRTLWKRHRKKVGSVPATDPTIEPY